MPITGVDKKELAVVDRCPDRQVIAALSGEQKNEAVIEGCQYNEQPKLITLNLSVRHAICPRR